LNGHENVFSLLAPNCVAASLARGQMMALLAACSCFGQGLLKQYDQVNAIDDNPPPHAGYLPVRTNMPFGQSFTPALSEVGFIELYLKPVGVGDAETLAVFLRQGGIDGPVLRSTEPVVLMGVPSVTRFIQEFVFPLPVSVTPGRMYTFEVVHLGGADRFGVAAPISLPGLDFHYPWGNLIGRGVTRFGSDLWFREDILIPEPSSAWLLVAGLGVLGGWWCQRKRRSDRHPPP
jgi:hypothetical protein